MSGTGTPARDLERQIAEVMTELENATDADEKAELQRQLDQLEDQLVQQRSYEAGLAEAKELREDSPADDFESD